jgi:hypothetical protein
MSFMWRIMDKASWRNWTMRGIADMQVITFVSNRLV